MDVTVSSNQENIDNLVLLSDIVKKNYEIFKNFWDDLVWFTFYCLTGTLRPKVKTAAKAIVSFVQDKLQLLATCTECFDHLYTHGEQGFMNICDPPHLIIWAWAEGYGFWPAKCMSVDEQTQMVNVRYYGDHTYGTIPSSECYLISQNRPECTHNTAGPAYDLALDEYNQSRQNIIQKHNKCAVWKDNTGFVIADFGSDQKVMIEEEVEIHDPGNGSKSMDVTHGNGNGNDTESNHTIPSPEINSPVSKKRRIGIDTDLEGKIKKRNSSILEKVEKHSEITWQYIDQLKAAIESNEEEIRSMKSGRNDEIQLLQGQIHELKEENRKLVTENKELKTYTKTCKSCGTYLMVPFELFCDSGCVK